MNSTETYHLLMQDILDNGKSKSDRTGTGTKSLFSRQIRFNLQEGFPLITTKRLHLKSIIYELLWFLKGDTNTRYLRENGVNIWNEWAGKNGELGPIYGKQWVNWGGWYSENHGNVDGTLGVHFKGINQIQNAIDTLKTDPDSRRIIVSAWNVGELKDMELPPCHWAFEFYTEELNHRERTNLAWPISFPERKNEDIPDWWNIKELSMDDLNVPKRRLSLKWHQRSVDVFLGLPFNIASYGLLLDMIAKEVNMIPYILIGDLTNVHIYDNHLKFVKEQLERDPLKHEPPKISINLGDVSNNGVPFKKSLFELEYEDFHVEKYKAYPNWGNVPIAV